MSASTQVDPRTRTYRTANPATGETLKDYEFISPEEAEAKLAKATPLRRNGRRRRSRSGSDCFAGSPISSRARQRTSPAR